MFALFVVGVLRKLCSLMPTRMEGMLKHLNGKHGIWPTGTQAKEINATRCT